MHRFRPISSTPYISGIPQYASPQVLSACHTLIINPYRHRLSHCEQLLVPLIGIELRNKHSPTNERNVMIWKWSYPTCSNHSHGLLNHLTYPCHVKFCSIIDTTHTTNSQTSLNILWTIEDRCMRPASIYISHLKYVRTSTANDFWEAHTHGFVQFQKRRPDLAEYIRLHCPTPDDALLGARRFQSEVRPDWTNVNIQKVSQYSFVKIEFSERGGRWTKRSGTSSHSILT